MLYPSQNSCLTALIGILSDPCVAGTPPPFYIEQIDGLDMQKLTQIAAPSDGSGLNYAKRIIQGAAAEMMGDLDLLIANGYSMRQNIGEVCSLCAFNGIYLPAGGIKVHNASLSGYSKIKITSIQIKTNATGDHVLRLYDGVTNTDYPVTLAAGVIHPTILDYETFSKDVYISLVDQTVGMAQIVCPTTSSCGCGGTNPAKNIVHYSGMVGALANATQYGFLVCANLTCSNEVLICEMIRQTPNLFGMTLLYKVGEKINNGSKLSLRLNRVKAQPDDVKDEETTRYNTLYRKRLNGTNQEMGIRQIVSGYLQRKSGDMCISCNSKTSIAYTTG